MGQALFSPPFSGLFKMLISRFICGRVVYESNAFLKSPALTMQFKTEPVGVSGLGKMTILLNKNELVQFLTDGNWDRILGLCPIFWNLDI